MSTIYYTAATPSHETAKWFRAEVAYITTKAKAGFLKDVQLIDNRDPNNPIRTVNETVQTIAIKCFLILLALPFYTMGVMAIHAIRCFTLIGSNVVKGELSEAFLSLIQEVRAVAKAPFYALAIAFCAAIGIVFPLTMRSVIAQLECHWSGSERFYDLLTKTSVLDALVDYFTNRSSQITIFLAFCFQPFGKLHDPQRVDNYRVIGPI